MPLLSPMPHECNDCNGRMLGLSSPLGALRVLEWDEVRQLKAGVWLRQCHEEGSMPLVPCKSSWTRGHRQGCRKGNWGQM